MSRAWLALIESNTTGTGRLFVQAALDLGFRPVLLTADPSQYDYVASVGELEVRKVDTANEQALLDTCREFRASGSLAGVTTSSEYFIASAAAMANQLGLYGPEPSAVRNCRDKGMQRKQLHLAEVGVPLFRVADSVAMAVEVARSISLPVVLKPASGTGSTGVRLCRTLREVKEHAGKLLALPNERGLPTLSRILVEEFIGGPEFSVETLGGEVIGITAKHLSAPPHFVETGHDFPCALSPVETESIRRVTRRALMALGLVWGPAHTELRLTCDGPKIIEVNPRLAGGMIPELVRLATNVDLIRETLRAVVGLPRKFVVKDGRFASIRFVVPQQQGYLVGVEGLEEVRSMPGVVSTAVYRKPGTWVCQQGDFRDRIGHVITCADDYKEAGDLADRALGMIRPSIAKSSGGNENGKHRTHSQEIDADCATHRFRSNDGA